MNARRLVLIMGLLCVLAAMAADAWVTDQEMLLRATPSAALLGDGSLSSGIEVARNMVMEANLPVYRSTVSTLGIVGWLLVGGSILAKIIASMQLRSRH